MKLECWSAKQRGRIQAALKMRTEPAKADDIAKTVAAVTNGDLTKGVEVPMPDGRRVAKGRDGAARGATRAVGSTKDATAAAGRAVGQRGGTGATGGKPDGKMSGLDAAAKVLAEAAETLNAKQIVEQAAAKGYWSSTAATPHPTLYSGMIIEIARRGDQARFKKVDRGLVATTEAAKQGK
jgi:hypothetical protein